jgi:hypothetical protein
MGIKNWFRRKENDVIDLRDLQKRGLLNKENIESSDSGSTVDLTSSPNPASALGFLGNLASSAGSEVSSETSSFSDSAEKRTKLRGVLRDMKVKINSSSERIYKISDRLDLLERKIERLERRSGV